MPDTPTAQALELVIEEQEFLSVLQVECTAFCALVEALSARSDSIWHKKHFFQLLVRFESLESLLDDYGARFNRTYSYLRELTASVRSFASAGYSLSHLASRLDNYGLLESLELSTYSGFEGNLSNVRTFIQGRVVAMLEDLTEEMVDLGLEVTKTHYAEQDFEHPAVRQRLPHNVDEEEPGDERQKVAEVASKFLLAADMLAERRFRPIQDAEERHRFLGSVCTEEQARVYEATVHNLQSAYDTYIKNTSLESRDPHLGQLRGMASAVLHMLEAVTALTHFYERHESDVRSEAAQARLQGLVDRSWVQERTLNRLLVTAVAVMEGGRDLAQGLLKRYTNAQELVVTLSGDLVLHARPAALIVGIVSRYGTPVELLVQGQTCNAGSILELLVTVGSHPDEKSFTFRGDENPLRDIALLFQYGLGEEGLEGLPNELGYLVQ
ncbi:MAG: HPr family phosphocarrier protein [Planctomycetota bacterium]|nr:HPr family phosphocarrier protein [Planctomycetota bacterium]